MGNSHKKLTIRDCKKIARAKEGECLSEECTNSNTPMRWKCKNNHTWSANFNTIQQGHWCHQCDLKVKTNDLVGKRFGKWTVLERALERRANGVILWRCQCDCGRTGLVARNTLIAGRSISCGCAFKKSKEWVALTRILTNYKHACKKRKHEFLLSREEVFQLISQNCFYCNKSPDFEYTKTLKVNGMDRLDSKIGYTKENTVPCCHICNIMKNKYTLDDFKNQIKKIYTYLKLNQKGAK